MTNRYSGQCVQCHETVPAGLGTVTKRNRAWRIDCNACTGRMAQSTDLVCVKLSSGWTGTRNARGRCEDAPCCGCCSF
jgi:hypothetical protein